VYKKGGIIMTDEHIEVSGETDIHRDSILAVLQGLMNGILKLKETITIEDVISNALDTFSDSQIDTLNEALASNRWDGLFRHLSDPTVLNMTEEEQKQLIANEIYKIQEGEYWDMTHEELEKELAKDIQQFLDEQEE
jgi:hypothetical protein